MTILNIDTLVDFCLTEHRLDDVDREVYLPPEVRKVISSYIFVPIEDGNIREAVALWCTCRSEAIMRYGHISMWNVRTVTNMSCLFENRRTFNDDISGWDVRNVRTMFGMFQNASAFNEPLNAWDVSSVISMNCMFKGASTFNQPLGEWDVSNV